MIEYDVILAQFEIFVLILMRMASFIFAAPIFNTANVPRRVKVIFSITLSILVYSLNQDMKVEYFGVVGYALLILKEVIVGILLGAIAAFCVQIIMFAGKIIDMDTGLSMAQIMDPTTRMQVGIFGNLYYYLLLMLLMVSGLHRYFVQAIFETFKAIPIGQMTVSSELYTSVIDFAGDYFIIGFRIALPVFSATLMLNCILAIMARVAPQMNMFVVGMQMKVFVGIFVIYFTVIMLPSVSNFIESEIKMMLATLVRGMSP